MRRVVAEVQSVVRWVWRHPSNDGKRIRQLGRAIMFQTQGRLLRRPFVTPLGDHSRVWAELHVSASSRALYANPPDVPEMPVWLSWLRGGDLFVDVGANVGLYTVLALERGAEVIAVEPDPTAVHRLKRNLALNGYAASVVESALADRSGERPFTVGLDSTNRLLTGSSAEESRTVPAITLDELLRERTARGVKIDVEGAEWLVLRGGERALRERRIELLQLEWNDCSRRHFGYDRAELAQWLSMVGYELVAPSAEGVMAPLSGAALDDVFARPG